MIKITLSNLDVANKTLGVTGKNGSTFTFKLWDGEKNTVPNTLMGVANKSKDLVHLVLEPAHLGDVDAFMQSKGFKSGENAITSSDFKTIAISYSKQTPSGDCII